MTSGRGFSEDMRLAHVLADQADSISLERFRAQDLQVDTKPDLTPVTEAVGGVQTPQAFRARDLLAAYRAADEGGFEGTDTSACVAAHRDVDVVAVAGSALNLKVTFPEDVALAEELSPAPGSARGPAERVGEGLEQP